MLLKAKAVAHLRNGFLTFSIYFVNMVAWLSQI
jgi:hypothetical protein